MQPMARGMLHSTPRCYSNLAARIAPTGVSNLYRGSMEMSNIMLATSLAPRWCLHPPVSRMYSERRNLRPWRPPNTSRREPAAQAAWPNISPGMSFLLRAVPVALRQVLLPANPQSVQCYSMSQICMCVYTCGYLNLAALVRNSRPMCFPACPPPDTGQ